MRDDGLVQGPFEIEVKIPIENVEAHVRQLQAAGFSISVPRLFEANTVYDQAGAELRKANMLLRLREAGDKSVLTWKGPEQPGSHKVRPEMETAVGSTAVMGQIFERLGYRPNFRYEKYRTEFKDLKEEGVVTVDETPIGNFLELEGPAEWIDRTAKKLGFTENQYVLESYGRLYLADCERRGAEPGNMVFASPSAETSSTR